MRTAASILLVGCLGLLVAGCGPSFSSQAQHGITFYCPGAGNIDFGDAGVREGLAKAGYRGQVASVIWTVSLNPAIDQAVKVNANIGGAKLARFIESYMKEYPGRPVNLIGLSAGTGVALYACERLKPGYEVDSVILLSGSISHDYDITKALQHVKSDGMIYNFYSPKDVVLAGPMKAFGTIDGKFGTDGAGAVGLTPPRHRERVVNIRWKPAYMKYGYYGGHTDVTSAAFVQAEISKYVVNETPTESQHAGEPNRWATVPLDARRY
ncbi:MAG: hypothetical protein JXO22_17185 [Phycisphaerae bacterium]|nr:hypothetical protein [Phycisphaerae bacterium]